MKNISTEINYDFISPYKAEIADKIYDNMSLNTRVHILVSTITSIDMQLKRISHQIDLVLLNAINV